MKYGYEMKVDLLLNYWHYVLLFFLCCVFSAVLVRRGKASPV